jgi:hypothetical protein
MPDTFIKIATATVGVLGAADITFSSIPTTYTDLVVKLSSRGDIAAIAGGNFCQFNGDTSTANYAFIQLIGDGSSTPTSTTAATTTGVLFQRNTGLTATANTFGNSEMYIANYTAAAHKSVSNDGVTENNATAADAALVAPIWKNTAAITSIKIFPGSGNFVQYTTATLYGIKNS